MFRTIAEAIIQVKSQKYGVLRAIIIKPNIVSTEKKRIAQGWSE